MIRTIELKRSLVAWLLGTMAVAASAPVLAEEDVFDGKWHFAVTPYLWLPSINGSLTYHNVHGTQTELSTTVDPNDYLNSLDAAAMLAGEVRKGEALIFTDYLYIHFGGQDATVKTVTGPFGDVHVPTHEGGAFSSVINIWTIGAGFAVLHGAEGFLDLFGGARLLSLSSYVNWSFTTPVGLLDRSGTVSASENHWDAIVGLKGQVRLGQTNWFVPYYGDVGGSSGNWTWQASGGMGYHFAWGDAVLLYRNLTYHFNDKVDLDVHLTGPMLGVTFKF
jgi:hypothetical protein